MKLPKSKRGIEIILKNLSSLDRHTLLYYEGIIRYFHSKKPFPGSTIVYSPDDQRFYYGRAKNTNRDLYDWNNYNELIDPAYIKLPGGTFIFHTVDPFHITLCSADWVEKRKDIGAEQFYDFVHNFLDKERTLWKEVYNTHQIDFTDPSALAKPLF